MTDHPFTAAFSHAFSAVPAEIKARKKTLEAVYLVYYQIWGEGLDKPLQPVQCCDLKYLPEEHINSLELKHLSFDESVLLVREEYEVTFTYLRGNGRKWKEPWHDRNRSTRHRYAPFAGRA
jgi:hypothetical protein